MRQRCAILRFTEVELNMQVQVDDQSTLPSSYRSFVAYGGYDEPYAPAASCTTSEWYWLRGIVLVPLEAGVDTHRKPYRRS